MSDSTLRTSERFLSEKKVKAVTMMVNCLVMYSGGETQITLSRTTTIITKISRSTNQWSTRVFNAVTPTRKGRFKLTIRVKY